MRILAKIDNLIDKDEALAMLDDFSDFIEEETGMKVTYWVERADFTNVPTAPDEDGDLKPTYAYMQNLADEVHSRYGDYGVDDIIMWVHEDNFLFKGIWGTALAYRHRLYNILLCRWDKDNSVNTFNTLFHEWTHPANTMLMKETNVDINKLVRDWILAGNTTQEDIAYIQANGFDWDRDYTHGGLPSTTYIGRRGYEKNTANLRILRFVAPELQKAYQKRLERHTASLRGTQLQLIAVLEKLVYAYRQLINKKSTMVK